MTQAERPDQAGLVLAAAVGVAAMRPSRSAANTSVSTLPCTPTASAGDPRVRSTAPGYSGWYWAVTLARPPRGKTPTIDEVVMLRAPTRCSRRHGCRGRSACARRPRPRRPGADRPRRPAHRAGLRASDDPAVEAVAFELGLGRERVMSREGRLDAAERWYLGEGGPEPRWPGRRRRIAAPARSCCRWPDRWPPASASAATRSPPVDGRVVSVEYGCGAHSEAKVVVPPVAEVGEVVYDDGEDDHLRRA